MGVEFWPKVELGDGFSSQLRLHSFLGNPIEHQPGRMECDRIATVWR